MNNTLKNFIESRFSVSKTDLFSAFIEHGMTLTKNNGYNCMVTMQSWMFLTAFDDFREKMLSNNHIVSMLHMDNMVMGIAFGTCATIFRKGYFPKYDADYVYATMNDIDDNGEPAEFPIVNNRLKTASIAQFEQIPRKPIAYWASNTNTSAYTKFKPLSYYADVKKGMSTADDKRFLRLWFEVAKDKFQIFTRFESAKWYWLNKGGNFRRWYGNNEYVVNWEFNGLEMKAFKSAVIRNEQYYFRDYAITWTYVTNYKLNARYVEKSTFAAVGPCIFAEKENLLYYLALLNSNVAQTFADNVGGETITYEVGEVASIPTAIIEANKDNIVSLANENIQISRDDWDSFETSWDFKRHPLI